MVKYGHQNVYNSELKLLGFQVDKTFGAKLTMRNVAPSRTAFILTSRSMGTETKIKKRINE